MRIRPSAGPPGRPRSLKAGRDDLYICPINAPQPDLGEASMNAPAAVESELLDLSRQLLDAVASGD